ncbi:MAG TPA: GreA/GreB family elongation factor [Opitutaceae bacterium]|nr:GreA/GreB family elongation factor [Opitutaceae bacterium]
MNNKPIYIPSEDHAKLRLLLGALLAHKKSPNLLSLMGELNRAVVVDPQTISPMVVRLGSSVVLRDLDSGEKDHYTLCLPERSNPETGMISVLAPIGTAILGYSENDVVEWETPGGTRRLEIQKVEQPQPTEQRAFALQT